MTGFSGTSAVGAATTRLNIVTAITILALMSIIPFTCGITYATAPCLFDDETAIQFSEIHCGGRKDRLAPAPRLSYVRMDASPIFQHAKGL
jgi:hypothetical protein